MALSVNTVWEVRLSNGNDTNGGAFVTGSAGTDFSQQNAKNSGGNNGSTTDGVANGSTTFTSATASFTSAIVGNVIYISGSGVTTGWYQVTAQGSSTSITLDRSPGTGTGLTMNIGGALLTLSQLNTNMATGHIGWVKNEAIISVTSHFQINFSVTGNNAQTAIIGYGTTRGDGGQFEWKVTSAFNNYAIEVDTAGLTIANFIIDCNNEGPTNGVGGIAITTGVRLINGLVKNVNANSGSNSFAFWSGANDNIFINCVATAITGALPAFLYSAAGRGVVYINCSAHGNSVPGFGSDNGATSVYFFGCIAANNTGSSSHGFVVGFNENTIMLNCIAYACGGDGFHLVDHGTSNYTMLNCVAYGNGGFGINESSGAFTGLLFDYNAYGSNTSGNLHNLNAGPHDVSLGSDPFTAGGSGDFSISPSGPLAGVGFPGVLQYGGTGHESIGALQPATSVSSAGMLFIPNLEGT